MDLRQLRYYTRIVELESITAASQALHVAQPSLSQHVAKLEDELGTPLLVRGPTGARATEAGEILYRQAKAILRQLEDAKSAVQQGFDTPAGHVTVGLPTSTSRILAVPLLQAVSRDYPEIQLELVEGATAELAEAVAQQKTDIAVAMEVRPRPGMRVTPILDEDVMLVCGPAHPGRGPVSLAEVAALPLMLPSFPNSIRVLYEQALGRANLPLKLAAETSAASILLAAVRAGIGCTLLPWSAIAESHEGAAPALAVRPFSDLAFTRRMSLCVSQVAQLSRTCQVVQALLCELIRQLVHSGRWQGVRLLPQAAPAG
ncbi:LysR substrate-binding domain-containing protein [Orrella sp. JC864]|uniref:LysR substrate-binding domain-containing protein n=1 Tax=Orrella sp. JC864 TaxID=3120298 RepID=UPI0012BCDF2D